MLIDVVLEAGGSYWRKRLDLPTPPAPGADLPVLAVPPVVATVVGLSEPDGQTSAAQTALLVRLASHKAAGEVKAELQRSGWRPLV